MRKVALIVLVLAGTVAGFAFSHAGAQETTKPKPSAGRVVHSSTVPAPQEQAAPAAQPEQRPTAAQPHAAAAESATPQPATTASVTDPAVLLPVGTTVRMKLETILSTMTSKRGDTFAGRVTEAVVLDGKTIIPVGASVEGTVARTSEPRRIKGVPVIDMKPESVTMPDGTRFAMSASVVDTSDPKRYHVDDEGRIKGSGHDSTDWRDAAIGAGGGVGALMTHSMHGAAVGAGVGTAAAFVRWMTRRHSETIPAGTELFLELSRPMTMTSSGSNGR